jgi:hypothetical protein
MGWNYAKRRSPLEWCSRPPYTVNGLGLPFEVGYKMERPSARITGSIPRSADLQVASGRDLVACFAL